MSPSGATFTAGGLSTSLRGSHGPWRFPPSDPTPRFLGDGPGELDLECSPTDALPRAASPLPENGNPWTISATNEGFSFFLRRPDGTPTLHLKTDPGFRRGTLAFNARFSGGFPLGPVAECLYACWLPGRSGLLVHGAALLLGGRAILALGHSGDGKSTLSDLWSERYGPESVLTDERPILRRQEDGSVYVYGTPWQGSGAYARSACAPLARIVTLRKSRRIELGRPRKNAARELLAHLILPPAGTHTMGAAFDLACEFGRIFGAREFRFRVHPRSAQVLSS